MFNAKENAITAGTTAQYFRGDKTFQTLNTSVVPEGTNLYYTDGRARGALSFAAGSGAYNTSTGVITIPTNNNQITNGAGYITAETDTLASVTGRGATTSTFSAFNGGLTATKTAKNTYGIQIKGSFFGAPRLQLYDLAADANAFMGLGTDMSGGAFEFSNYFPRTGGNGRWSVGSWAGDFGTGQYVSGYNEKLYITESVAQFNVGLTIVGNISATNLSGTNTGNVTIGTANGLSLIGQALSLGLASGSANGALSSTDWTTFNSKQNALTNPVTGTGETNYLPKFTGSTTIGNSQIFNDGNNVGINTSTGFNQISSVETTLKIANSNVASLYLEVNGVRGYANFVSPAGNLVWYDYTAASSRMFLFSDGNLLLTNGTASNAGFKLDVNGTGRFSGNVTAVGGIINGSDFRYNPAGNTSGNPVLVLKNPSTGVLSIASEIIGDANVNSNSLALSVSNATNGRFNALTIASTGAATFSASLATPHTTKSANYTLTASDYTVGFDCASNRTATLPDATTCAGRIYVIYQYNTNFGVRSVTLDGNGSQTIDGVTTYSLAFFEDFSSVMIQSNGSNWIVIADKLYPPVT
jgi:hypothetical protein